MAIKLDIFKSGRNKDSFRNFTYADLNLDIEFNANAQSVPVNRSHNPQDLKLSYDHSAIYNSIRNIFNTKKGQKILNPEFGLDLEQFLFDSITKENADIIGKAIYGQLGLYEPRLTVASVDVVARPNDHEYKIKIAIILPSLNNQKVQTTGTLTQEGFNYI
jgi:phage baseplate assembly protein W